MKRHLLGFLGSWGNLPCGSWTGILKKSSHGTLPPIAIIKLVFTCPLQRPFAAWGSFGLSKPIPSSGCGSCASSSGWRQASPGQWAQRWNFNDNSMLGQKVMWLSNLLVKWEDLIFELFLVLLPLCYPSCMWWCPYWSILTGMNSPNWCCWLHICSGPACLKVFCLNTFNPVWKRKGITNKSKCWTYFYTKSTTLYLFFLMNLFICFLIL